MLKELIINWYQHDTDATQDAKIKKLLIRHGAIGYAVYFHCLELIMADVCETNITFELEHDSEIIADNLRIKGTGEKSGREIVEDVMRTIVDLGLFTSNNGHIFCFKLLTRINLSMTSNKNLREAITKAKDENHDEIMTHHATYLPTKQPTYQLEPPEKEAPDQPSKPKRVKKEFIPPTLEEVTNYIIEKGFCVDPSKFISWYDPEWIDKDGNKISNWKNKIKNWNQRELDRNPNAIPYSSPTLRISTAPLPDIECCGQHYNFDIGFCLVCGKKYNRDGTVA